MHDPDALIWLPTPEMPVREAALVYAEHGWKVIAVHGIRADGRCTCGAPDGECKPGKHPIGKAWQKRATCDVDAVRDMFRQAPREANIGLALGEQGDGTYLVAIDIDGDRGRAVYAEYERDLGPLPMTLASRSGREDGGEHRIAIIGPGQDVRRLSNSAKQGLDVRVRGGQIVICPSLHLSGARYSWANGTAPAVLPDAWFERIAKPLPPPRSARIASVHRIGNAYVDKVIENMVADLSCRREGERNHVLWAKTCTALEYCSGHRLPWESALDRIAEAARASGLPAKEVEVTIGKAVRHVERTGAVRVAPPPQKRVEGVPEGGDASTGESGGESANEDRESWRARLMRNPDQTLDKTPGNAAIILRHDPAWVGRIRWNTFAERIEVNEPPWDPEVSAPGLDGVYAWTDVDDFRAQAWIRRRYHLTFAGTDIAKAVETVARSAAFHPVQEWLRTLTWDGTKRLDTWLVAFMGVTDSKYAREVARKFLIAAVARAMDPGCQVDSMLILEGDQGTRKSSALRTLAGEEWFLETQIDIRDPNAVSVFRKRWIVEFAELAALRGADVERVKQMITTRVDTYRPPYGRHFLDYPRQCVLVGSTNEEQYLKDSTGARRFWPVWVERIDLEGLTAARDQLWAEAVRAYDAGEPWHFVDDEVLRQAEAEQAARFSVDPWEDPVRTYLERPGRSETGVTTADLLGTALGIEAGRRTRADEMRVGSVLRRLGWARRRARIQGEPRLAYLFFPKEGSRRVVGTSRGAAKTGVVPSVPSSMEETNKTIQEPLWDEPASERARARTRERATEVFGSGGNEGTGNKLNAAARDNDEPIAAPHDTEAE